MTAALWVLGVVVILALLGWLTAHVYLSGPDIDIVLDGAIAEHFEGAPESAAAQAVVGKVHALRQSTAKVPITRRIAATRAAWETLFPDQSGKATFISIHAGDLRGEWVLAPGADPARRTLYLHGGAYAVGSAHSHRPLTVAFSRLTGGAVLALDYRLLPEHTRIEGIDDTRAAYRWMLDHGPDGAAAASTTFVAGDSAGGNLTLSLIAWIRDQDLRAPAAAVVLSPQTDSTMASASWHDNLATDPMLGPSYKIAVKAPRTLVLFAVWLQNRINPRDPVISPLFGNLTGLPPTLIQVSASEMLRDDSVRYAERARAAGAPITLQIWPGMVHVWQLFNPELPEADAALGQIGAFIERVAPEPAKQAALAPAA